MRSKNQFWWFSVAALILTFATVGFIVYMFWSQLALDEKSIFYEVLKERFIYFFGAGFILFLGFGIILDGIFHLYILPIKKVTEELHVMQSVNPSHRISGEGGKGVGELIRLLNRWADRSEALQQDVSKQIESARRDIEEERNMFAAILSELPQGVIICNAEGQILLCDKQARQFLEAEPPSNDSEATCRPGHFIGLGRSIFGVMEKNHIVHALDEIALKLERQETDVASRFVMVSPSGNLLKVELLPVLDECDRICTGYALIMEDITRRIEKEGRIEALLQEVTTGIRTSLAAIRSAVESMMAYPQMDAEKRRRFETIIHDASMTIGSRVNAVCEEYPRRLFQRWPRVRTAAIDFLEMVKRQAQAKLGIPLKVETPLQEAWIDLDGYSALLAILFLLSRLKQRVRDDAEEGGFTLELGKKDGFLYMDFHWSGEPVTMAVLRTWKEEPLHVNGALIPLPLGQIFRYHEAEILPLSETKGPGTAALRILFPEVQRAASTELRMPLTLLPGSRPEFYDFDLFDHYGQASELDDRLLSELSYTVFDTETTGLNLREGDEIISIGAVRIVNGRLLKEDVFDQLVNPGRLVSPESFRIHGISDEMLKGQPPIEQVLPLFHRFAQGTVLVAHNAAFDMQMLRLKEEKTGVRFTAPVLDTLLLSAALHPTQDNHDLETIARRLGVSVIGRHTALGDAIVTGEIFLKLIALLEQIGVRTLKEAMALSQKTFYARKRY